MEGENMNRGIITAVVMVSIFIFIAIGVTFLAKDLHEQNTSDDNSMEEKNVRSIFFGKDPDEVANLIGVATRNTTFLSSQVEFNCGSCIWKDYNFGNDDHVNVEYTEYGDDEYYYRTLYFAKSGFKDNIGDWNDQYVIDHMKEVLNRLLDPFGISQTSDYRMDIIPWGSDNDGWNVEIVQILDGFEVDGTGMLAHISRENGEIRTMTMYDWIIPEYEFNKTISIEVGKELIFSELEALDMNLSYSAEINITDPVSGNEIIAMAELNKEFILDINDVDYVGPALFDGHLCYRYDVELTENRTLLSKYTFMIDVESGLILKWEENYEMGGRSSIFLGNLIGEEESWSDLMKQYTQ